VASNSRRACGRRPLRRRHRPRRFRQDAVSRRCQVAPDGKPHRVKFQPRCRLLPASRSPLAERHLVPGCVVHSDGWPVSPSWPLPVTSITSPAPAPAPPPASAPDDPTFRWINTLLGISRPACAEPFTLSRPAMSRALSPRRNTASTADMTSIASWSVSTVPPSEPPPAS
jgi:hypothetical protein